MIKDRYSLNELKAMKTLDVSHFEDLKVEEGNVRVWLSRMTVQDGAPYNNQVTVEEYDGKDWKKIDEYRAMLEHKAL